MDDIGLGGVSRPTVAQMLMRDVLVYVFLASPFVILAAILAMSAIQDAAPEEEAFDLTYMYGVLVLEVGVTFVVIYRRKNLYSSVLDSGVEVPGKVVSVTRSGENVVVEYEYRWQAQTMKSSKRVMGYIPKRRAAEAVGATATLLVDPSKPERFLLLDTVR